MVSRLTELKRRIAALVTSERAGVKDASVQVLLPDGTYHEIVDAVYPDNCAIILLIARPVGYEEYMRICKNEGVNKNAT
jgi:hypothetical protein